MKTSIWRLKCLPSVISKALFVGGWRRVQSGATVNPKIHEGTWLAQPYIEGHYDSVGGVTIEGGHIALPVGPGLGITPDPAVFTREVGTF